MPRRPPLPHRVMLTRFAELQAQHDATQRQQAAVVVDPTGGSGDPSENGATFAFGDLSDFGISAYGAAVWDPVHSIWVQIVPPFGGSGGYASLTGPGQTTTPGDLTQAGGLEVDVPNGSGLGFVVSSNDLTNPVALYGETIAGALRSPWSGLSPPYDTASMIFGAPNTGSALIIDPGGSVSMAMLFGDEVRLQAEASLLGAYLLIEPSGSPTFRSVTLAAADTSGSPQDVILTAGDPARSVSGPNLHLHGRLAPTSAQLISGDGNAEFQILDYDAGASQPSEANVYAGGVINVLVTASTLGGQVINVGSQVDTLGTKVTIGMFGEAAHVGGGASDLVGFYGQTPIVQQQASTITSFATLQAFLQLIGLCY